MRRLIAAAAALLATIPGTAQAAEPPCLSSAEFASLASYALPSIISGTTQRCASTLGTSSFLRSSGAQLSGRYAERKASAWPGAKAAFLKLSATGNQDANKLIAGMPDTSLQQMLDGMMEGMIGQQIPLERCGTIDNVVRLLAPLPPQNTAELIALAVGLGAQTGRAKVGAIRLCPAAAQGAAQ
jgi:hypothetical protein